MLTATLDTAVDRSVLFGYSRIGHASGLGEP